MTMPAISLAAVHGRRQQTLEIAAEIERRGFTGIYCPSMGDCVALCQSIASVTNEITFGTSVQPIYFRNPEDLAATAAFIHEISNGRFRLGIGVTHGPVHQRLGITPDKPLADIPFTFNPSQKQGFLEGTPVCRSTVERLASGFPNSADYYQRQRRLIRLTSNSDRRQANITKVY